MYISGIIFFFRMHFMCIFIYVGLLYCSVFISYTFLYAPFSFFTSHITSNTVYIKHSGRNFTSVCQVIYLFFVEMHVCVHFFGAFYFFDVWKPWYLSYRCHIIIIFWYHEVLNLGPMHNILNPSSILQNIKSPMNYWTRGLNFYDTPIIFSFYYRCREGFNIYFCVGEILIITCIFIPIG